MRNKWDIRNFNVANAIESNNTVHDHPILDQIYKQRGITTPDDLVYDPNKMIDPFLMKGMEEAVQLLIKHILADSKIIIIGDFDCDGATATTIGLTGLQMLGAKNISFLIPDRKEHGYGLTDKIVAVAGKDKPDLIVTVDNGITSIDGVNAVHALEHPCEILITDHHLPAGDTLPSAEAIVNPSQPGCGFPSKALAGCGVMFYVVVALRQRMRKLGLFEKLGIAEPNLSVLLDTLAVGSVADLVPLDLNNRILVKMGLDRINAGLARPGLAALMEAQGAKVGQVVASDIGFKIGPCINATGRISDGSLAVRLLTANKAEAEELAGVLVDLNQQRKSIQKEMTDDAMVYIESAEVGDNYAITLFLEDAHEGVLGIVAGRVKDMANRPVVCLAPSKDPEVLKGSARSRAPINIRHAFDKIASIDPEVFVGYGGHAMAAGLSIHKAKLQDFERLFDQVVSEDLTAEMIKGDINVDMMLPGHYLTMDMANTIALNGPWGMKFEEPIFGANLVVKSVRLIGDQKQHLKLVLEDPTTGTQVDGIRFFCIEDEESIVEVGNTIQVAFTLDINEFRGRKSLQLMIRDCQDVELCKKMSSGGYTPVITETPSYGQGSNSFSKNTPKTFKYSVQM